MTATAGAGCFSEVAVITQSTVLAASQRRRDLLAAADSHRRASANATSVRNRNLRTYLTLRSAS